MEKLCFLKMEKLCFELVRSCTLIFIYGKFVFLNGNTLKLDSIHGKFVFFREEIDLILSIHGKIVFFIYGKTVFFKDG